MSHTHTFLLPAQDGIHPITERITGVCACGEVKEHQGLWEENNPGNWRITPRRSKVMEIDAFVAGLGYGD